MRIFLLALTVIGASITGMALAQTTSYDPQPGDAKLTRSKAYLDRADVSAGALNGPGALNLAGNVPTPCHDLRVNIPAAPDSTGTLAIDVYSVSDPRSVCAQVIKPFTASIMLTPAQLRANITVNGKAASSPSK